jgi:hypothetical protein
VAFAEGQLLIAETCCPSVRQIRQLAPYIFLQLAFVQGGHGSLVDVRSEGYGLRFLANKRSLESHYPNVEEPRNGQQRIRVKPRSTWPKKKQEYRCRTHTSCWRTPRNEVIVNGLKKGFEHEAFLEELPRTLKCFSPILHSHHQWRYPRLQHILQTIEGRPLSNPTVDRRPSELDDIKASTPDLHNK